MTPRPPRELIAHPDLARRDTSTLATLGGGGAQLQPDLVDDHGNDVPDGGFGRTVGARRTASGKFVKGKLRDTLSVDDAAQGCTRTVPTA